LYTSRVLGLRPSALFIEFEITYQKKNLYIPFQLHFVACF